MRARGVATASQKHVKSEVRLKTWDGVGRNDMSFVVVAERRKFASLACAEQPACGFAKEEIGIASDQVARLRDPARAQSPVASIPLHVANRVRGALTLIVHGDVVEAWLATPGC